MNPIRIAAVFISVLAFFSCVSVDDTAEIFKISFDKNDAAATGTMAQQEVTSGTTATLLKCTFAKTGWRFSGWAATADGAVAYADQSAYKMGNGNATLFARWSINTNQVAFDKNDALATGSMSPQSIAYGATAALVDNAFAKTGCSFAGWATNATGSVVYANQANYTMGTNGQTLFAKWTNNLYRVTFDKNDASATGTMSQQVIAYQGTANLTVNGYTWTGKHFGGWATTAGGAIAYANQGSYTMGAGDVTLYAIWVDKLYTVSFEVNGGSTVASQSVGHGGLVAQPAEPIKSGHVFSGWYADSEFVTAWNFASRTVTADTTIYAKWIPQYTVSFEVNGGSTVASQTIISGGLVTKPADPVKAGYTFMGWYEDSAFVTSWNFATRTVTANATIYANWGVDLLAGYQALVYVASGTFSQQADSGTGFDNTLSEYYIGKYEVTYDLWYSVFSWGSTHGYQFANFGREGHDGTVGNSPTASRYEPVTTINWRDAIVWCNAYSEMSGLVPVYYSDSGFTVPHRDSRDGSYGASINNNSGSIDNPYVLSSANGFRLPTEGQWQYAAAYKNGTSWTPYNFASGATASYSDATATGVVAWHAGNSGSTTKTVGSKTANSLGIHDMSGNVWEWCVDWTAPYPGTAQNDYSYLTSGTVRILKGGGYDSTPAAKLQISYRNGNYPYDEGSNHGFRLVRSN